MADIPIGPLILALLLVACAHEAPGPCRLQPMAELPVSTDRNRLDVTGRINGTDTPLVIDTGAERTVMSAATAVALLLPRSKISATRLAGIAGTVSNADVFADMALGNAEVRQRFALADIPGIGGLVGADVLSGFDVEFDLPTHRVRLWHAANCGAMDLPWSGPRSTIPVHVAGGGQLRLPVTIDGKPVDAMLDSGAAFSLLQTDAARRLGVTQAALSADPAVMVRGVDGGVIGVRMHRFSALDVGGATIPAPLIGVGDSQLGTVEMILGLDYLRGRRVWVSYRTGQIFVQ